MKREGNENATATGTYARAPRQFIPHVPDNRSRPAVYITLGLNMAPGFLLLLAVVFLGALAPVTLALGVGGLYFNSARPHSLRLLSWGALGGIAVVALLRLVLAFLQAPVYAWSEWAILFGAGFTVCGVGGTVAQAMFGLMGRSVDA